jgi:hypothetical protein
VARTQVERTERDRDLYKRQLDAVDENLPPWEPPPGESCVGRVQTILNLKADRAQVERMREAAAEMVEAFGKFDGSAFAARDRLADLLTAVPEAASGCVVNKVSSRMCEHGTKGCDVLHGVPDPEEDSGV